MRHRLVWSSEQGAVTAEFAIAMPAVMAVVLVLLGAFAMQLQRFELSEQAAVAARAFARGEELSLIEGWFKKPTSIEFLEQDELVCAVAIKPLAPLGLGSMLLELSAKHCARRSGL